MTEEQNKQEEPGKVFFNLDKKFMFLVALVILYAVSKSFNDNNSVSACQTEMVKLYSGDDYKLDSFCLCQNNFLNEHNDWFVKEGIRKNGLIDFFMKEDTTGTKEPILKCLKNNIENPKTKSFELHGDFKELMIKKCIKLVEDDDFRKKHDLELYCSCYMNKNKNRMTINTVFENNFFFKENFQPLDTLCLQMSFR